jgi:uroporphyrinogen III methyltransferase/synthase
MPTILLTRPEHQAEPMKPELESLGFRVLLQPAVDIAPPDSWNEVDQAVEQLRQDLFDWIIFSSSNGIRFFLDRLPVPKLKVQIAVVGSGTEETLKQCFGCPADLVPADYTAEGVVEGLLNEAKAGKRFLILRASRGRDILKQRLSEAGGAVTEVAVYQSLDREKPKWEILELMQQGQIDFVTVTSSAIGESLVKMFGRLLYQTKLISISPITSEKLRSLGFPPKLEAAEASMQGIVQLLKAVRDSVRS